MRPGLRKVIWGVLVLVGAAGLVLAILHERAGNPPLRRPSPLAAGSKLARPEGELGELKRRLRVRRDQSIRELKTLIQQLETEVGDHRALIHEQQTQLSEVEADLDRARALLRQLEEHAPASAEAPAPAEPTPEPGP